jgi:hypothetical protein
MGGKFIHQLLIAAIGIVIMLAPAYSATIQPYSDPSVFGGMTQGMTLVNFDDQVSSGGTSYDFTGAGFTIGGVQFGAIPVAGFENYIQWKPSTQYDWGTNAVLQTSGGANSHLHIALPGGGATAIGLNLMSFTSDGMGAFHSGATYTINLSTGNAITPVATAFWNTAMASSPNAAGVKPTWWGITSDAPITYLDLYSSEGAIVIDNFQFGTASNTPGPEPPPDVPEASTMILIGTGLVSLRFLNKFRTREAV